MSNQVTSKLRAKDVNLSGNSYVPMRAKDDPVSVPTSPTQIKPVTSCEHLHTICPTCADSWEADWHVFYNRTAGGRKLFGNVHPHESIEEFRQ